MSFADFVEGVLGVAFTVIFIGGIVFVNYLLSRRMW